MGNIVEIKNLNFSYKQKKVFENFSFNIKEGSFTTIIGPNGSGKSTLARIMFGLINAKSYVKIDNMFINPKNIKEIRREVGIAFENPDNHFVSDTVKEDMVLSLKNYNYSKEKINEKICAVSKILDIENLLDREPHNLSGGEKQLVALAIALAHEPKLLILDEALVMIDPVTRLKIYRILKSINKNGITIINITHDSEDMLMGTDVVVINNGNLVLQEKLKDAFNNVKLFTDNAIELPFVVDLSKKLQYYKIIDKIYFDNKKLVDAIWK